MNKRSAVLIAAGLVLTLGIGGLAVSLGLTGPAAGAADLAGPQRVVEIQQSVAAPPTGSDAAPGSVESDDLNEHEEGAHEDAHEGEDHDDHEMDDSEDEG
jgi:hypothetical protein